MDLLDLRKLSDLDFENLCKDIFEHILGVRLEIFASGPDGGIDLRYLGPDRNIVIQCKHWMNSGRAKLVKHLIDKELPKLDQITPLPMRYILATSVEMTPSSKATIASAFSPYIQSPGDIFGISEITSILQRNPKIIRKHMRLWLNDSTILESMISKNVIQRSLHLADDITDALRTYVPSSDLHMAMDLIEENHVVLISGPPGVGKTTMAQVICARYADRGFELVEVSENVEDVYRVWHDREPQIFIYDDFLGQTSLDDKLHKNEDRRLLSLIRRIRKDPTKRFVCTTREYILQQARQRYERMDQGDLDPFTLTIDLDDLEREERAQILYNHVYWSGWPLAAKRVFSQPDVYRPIIRHKSFNPRSISNLLSVPFDPDLGKSGDQALAALNNPIGLWRHLFDNQLKDSDRDILYILFSLGGKSSLSRLGDAYLDFSQRSLSQFKASLKVLNGTLVKVTDGATSSAIGEQSNSRIEFSNPSVNDFMLVKFSEERDLVLKILRCPYSFDQITLLTSYHDAPPESSMPARLNLMPLQAEVETAALATLDRDLTTSQPQARRAMECLRIGRSLGSAKVRNWALRKLRQPGFVYRASSEDAISLIEETRTSGDLQVKALHDSVRLEGLTSLFNKVGGDRGLFIAAGHAMDLAKYVDDGIRETICSQADEAISALLLQYSEDPDDVEVDLIDDALQYILRHEDHWQTKWPNAEVLLSDWPLEGTGEDFEGSDEEGDIDPEYIDGEAYLIMNSLNYLE
ncbi:nSTAND3 domain-containing NTPase [Streptomyces sp. NPDC055886]